MVLSDASTGEPVGFATVSLTDTTTAKTYKFALSADDGKVSILGVRNGVFLLKAEMMGYRTYANVLKWIYAIPNSQRCAQYDMVMIK